MLKVLRRFLVLMLCAPAIGHTSYKNLNLTMEYGQDVKLKEYHDIILRARCLRLDGNQADSESIASGKQGEDILFIYATTTSPAILRGEDNYVGDGSYLTTGTPAYLSRMLLITAPNGVERFDNGVNGSWVLGLADLHGLTIAADKAVLAVNPLGRQGCYFSVMIDKITVSKAGKRGFVLR